MCLWTSKRSIFNEGLSYFGLNESICNFWNTEHFDYIVGKYPCKLPVRAGDIAVSVLCLTWNCYLVENEKTLTEQCESLKRDFEHCLLYLAKDKIDFVSQYFKCVEKIDGNLYYFSNK